MAAYSKIEWCDHTFNPWIGCQEVSPACDNCYARVQNGFRGWVKGWGPHGERRRTKTWGDPKKFNRAAEAAGVRAKVFCLSLGDIGDSKVPQEWREYLKPLVRETPFLDWLFLTKRPQNLIELYGREFFERTPNIWVGATAENQEEYDRRRLHLLAIPAAVHFFSVEPMLGPLIRDTTNERGKNVWYICGGESAKGTHRPMDLAWARALRDSCAATQTPFFMKQIDKVQPIPDDLMIREFPRN